MKKTSSFLFLILLATSCRTTPDNDRVKLNRSATSVEEPYILSFKYDPLSTCPSRQRVVTIFEIDGETVNNKITDQRDHYPIILGEPTPALALLIPPGEHLLRFNWKVFLNEGGVLTSTSDGVAKFIGLPGKKYELQLRCDKIGNHWYLQNRNQYPYQWKLIEAETGKTIAQSMPETKN
jgi:hypothetical protein